MWTVLCGVPWPGQDNPWASAAAETGAENLTSSYWASFTLKTKVLEPVFSQNLNFYEHLLSSVLPSYLTAWTIRLPVCASHADSCCLYWPCRLNGILLSPWIVQISVEGIIVCGCLVSQRCDSLFYSKEACPWKDCVATGELSSLWCVILPEVNDASNKATSERLGP